MSGCQGVFLTLSGSSPVLGESRFFGSPDLPEGFIWPKDLEGYDLEFIAQINCKDIASYSDIFPKSGMLYFFGSIANALGEKDAPEIKEGFQNKDDFAAKYSDASERDLQEGEIVDENGAPYGFSPLKIGFSLDENISTSFHHQILGEIPGNAKNLNDYILLFCLDSFSGDDFTLEFKNSGYLYFLIKREDLAKRYFDNVLCYLDI